MDFITKLPLSREPGIGQLYDSILTIIDRTTKWTYAILVSENYSAEELIYKVRRTLKASYRMLKEFVTDRDKLFTLAF